MPPVTKEPITVGNDGAGATTVWERLSQSFLRPATPKAAGSERVDFSRMSDDEKRTHIVGVDATERKLGIVASLLAVVIALASFLPYMVSKRLVALSTDKPKSKSCSPVAGVTHLHYVASTKTCDGIYPASHFLLPLVVVLVLAAAIYVTVRIRRRSALAFTMVMTGLALGSFLYLLPYGVAGGWVMLRAWRTQKYGSPTAKSALTGWVAPPPRGSARRAKATTPRGKASGKGKSATTTTTRKPPPANKRYTPKAPPKKKVAPPAS